MGVSAVQHRACVGMFAGGRAPAPPWSGGGQYRSWWWWIVTMIMYVLLKVMECKTRVTQTVIFHTTSSTSLYDGCFYLTIGSVVTRLLLIIAGDIKVRVSCFAHTSLNNYATLGAHSLCYNMKFD